MKAEPSLSIFISIDALSSLLFRFVPNRFFSVRARRDRVLLPPSSASANWSSVALLGAFVVSFFSSSCISSYVQRDNTKPGMLFSRNLAFAALGEIDYGRDSLDRAAAFGVTSAVYRKLGYGVRSRVPPSTRFSFLFLLPFYVVSSFFGECRSFPFLICAATLVC